MPWSNRDDDPSVNGGHSGPWGGGGSGGGRRPPPDVDDIIRSGQEKFRSFFSGGKNSNLIILLLVAAVALWGLSGFYRVNTTQQGVVLRFGEWVGTTPPGLHYHIPAPIESVLTPDVTTVNKVEVGFRSLPRTRGNDAMRNVPEEALMLTGDENIVDISFTVFWVIKDAGEYLFNVRNPSQAVKSVAESAMRDVIGRTPINPILSEGKVEIADQAKRLIQNVLDGYKAGISIQQVRLNRTDPPEPVIEAFRDVQRARTDQQRLRNQAEAYRNDIIPRARGTAEKIIQAGRAYKEKVIVTAEGNAQRFLSVYDAYKTSKDVIRRRIYLETMEEVLADVNKVIIDDSAQGGDGVITYLPLPEIQKRAARAGDEEAQ